MDSDFSNSSMIAFLPDQGDWCEQDLPHMTLVFTGEIDALSPLVKNILLKETFLLSASMDPFTLRVTGLEKFGAEDKVDVYTLEKTKDLINARYHVSVYDKSEFDFSPHVTIGKHRADRTMKNAPKFLTFSNIVFSWGLEKIVYPLAKKLNY